MGRLSSTPGVQTGGASWSPARALQRSSGRIPVLPDNGEGAVTPRSQALQLLISPGTSEGSYSPA